MQIKKSKKYCLFMHSVQRIHIIICAYAHMRLYKSVHMLCCDVSKRLIL